MRKIPFSLVVASMVIGFLFSSNGYAAQLGWVWTSAPRSATVGQTITVSAKYYTEFGANNAYFCCAGNANGDYVAGMPGVSFVSEANGTAKIKITSRGNGVLYVIAQASGAPASDFIRVSVSSSDSSPVLTLSSPLSEVTPGTTVKLTYTATGGSGSPTWSISSPVADTVSNGFVQLSSVYTARTVTVTATYSGLTKSVSLFVIAPILTLSSPVSEAKPGTTVALTYTATGGSGSPTWSISSPVADTVANGMVQLSSVYTARTVTVTATYSGLTKSVLLYVIAPVLTLSSPVSEAKPGTTVALTYTATGGSGSPTWSISSPVTDTVANGIVQLSSVNTARTVKVTVTYSGLTKAVSLSVKAMCDPPVITPGDGTVFSTPSQNVVFSCATAGATIYYTLDGSTPSYNSLIYSGAFNITNDTIIKAFSSATGFYDSEITTAKLTQHQATPSVPKLTSIEVLSNPTRVMVCGTGRAGAGYELQWSQKLGSAANWLSTGFAMADTDGKFEVSDVAPADSGFYRMAAETSAAVYLVVDMNGGTNALRWPVTELKSVPKGGWTDEYKTTKLVLRRIPAGTFTMGSPEDELGRVEEGKQIDEQQHEVTLTNPFYMGVFEVTQRQWELALGTRPSYFTNKAYYATRPVEQVCYDDIRGKINGAKWPATNTVDTSSFLGVLRTKTGLNFDLPTEAQWEYACRAGTTTALNSGKNLTDEQNCTNMAEVGRYGHNSGSYEQNYNSSSSTAVGTAEVGNYPPNAWDLYDMHGNVWECCLDWYGDYGSVAVTNPGGVASESIRVQRGGSWASPAQFSRSAYRRRYSPSRRGVNTGLRLCCPSEQP